jgi:hypothetical protein
MQNFGPHIPGLLTQDTGIFNKLLGENFENFLTKAPSQLLPSLPNINLPLPFVE